MPRKSSTSDAPKRVAIKTNKTRVERVPIYCLWCGNNTKANFYITKDKHRGYLERIPYCKSCIQKIFEEYLKKYDNNLNLAVYYTARKIDIPYIHTAFIGALENVRNPNSRIFGEDSIMKAYIKNLSFAEKNGWGTSFDDSQGENEIEGLSSFEDVVKVKKHVKKTPDVETENYDIIEMDSAELVRKWGNFDDEDLAYLESEYLDWEQQLNGIIDKNTEIMVRQICLQCNEIRKDREEERPVEKKIATLQSLFKTSGLIDLQNNESVEKGIGMNIQDIEYKRPIKEPDPELADVDNIRAILLAYLGGTSRALGKENKFTEQFDEAYKKYNIEEIEDIRNNIPKETDENADVGS